MVRRPPRCSGAQVGDRQLALAVDEAVVAHRPGRRHDLLVLLLVGPHRRLHGAAGVLPLPGAAEERVDAPLVALADHPGDAPEELVAVLVVALDVADPAGDRSGRSQVDVVHAGVAGLHMDHAAVLEAVAGDHPGLVVHRPLVHADLDRGLPVGRAGGDHPDLHVPHLCLCEWLLVADLTVERCGSTIGANADLRRGVTGVRISGGGSGPPRAPGRPPPTGTPPEAWP